MLKKIILLILSALSFQFLYAGNPVSVPLHHPVYLYFDRLETKGIIDGIRGGVKPFTRSKVSKILLDINSNREELTVIDRQHLENFLADFRYEIDHSKKYEQVDKDKKWYSTLQSFSKFKNDVNRFFKQNNPEEENHVVVWEDSTNSFYFDFIQDFTFDINDNFQRYANSQTYAFRGTVNENFGYALTASLIAVRGDTIFREQDPILKEAWAKDQGGKVLFDRTGGEIAYQFPHIDFRLAQQQVYWGVGESGSLFLSDYSEQYSYLGLSANWSWGTFSFMQGKLLSAESSDSLAGQPYRPDKWIAAHRLEITPYTGLTLGVSEAVIYGNRSIEFAYLIPFNFYRAIEHNLEDRDNKMISIDAEWIASSGYKFYGAVFLDEFKQSKLFTNWFGNKHAFLFGTHIVDPFFLENFSLRFEYVAIMPWVYTHKYFYNRFISTNRSLGYWAGPNSEVFYAHLRKDWHHRLNTGIKFQQWKHGDNYENENIGGDILQGRNKLLGLQTVPKETRKFLEGILSTNILIEFYLNYEIFNDLYLNFTYANLDVAGPNSGNETEFHFGFRLDY